MKLQKSLWLFLTIFITLIAGSCTSNAIDDDPEPVLTDQFTIWSGSKTTFVKSDGADPTIEGNQDRITDNLWITRGNDGGQIFNAAVESSSTKDSSPTGTLWAQGTTSDIENLDFGTFRSAIKPKESIGEDLVLLILEDSIAIDLKITNWSESKESGFSYERSTQ